MQENEFESCIPRAITGRPAKDTGEVIKAWKASLSNGPWNICFSSEA